MTVTTESREFLDPDEFADATESEALKAGRVLLAFTFDEEVIATRWFEGLPDDLYNSESVEPAYERCVNAR
jgi:hypothetical protein